MLFILLLFLPFVLADWPPTKCVQLNNNRLIMTSRTSQMSKCVLEDRFENVFFAQFSRLLEDDFESSLLEFVIQTVDDKTEIVSIRIGNGRLGISSESSCRFESTNGNPKWIRVRLQPMMDTQQTHIHVAYDTGEMFKNCASTTLQNIYSEFALSLEAETKNGMLQTVDIITKKKPDQSRINYANANLRMDRLEERLRRLQSVVTDYIDSHDRLQTSTTNQHRYLQNAIAGTHNRIVSRSNAHGIFYMFMFCILFICGIAYTRWKSGEDKRFHMP